MRVLVRKEVELHVSKICPSLLGEASVNKFEQALVHTDAQNALAAFANGDSAFLIVSCVQLNAADSDYDYAESMGSVSVDEDEIAVPPDRHPVRWFIRVSTDLRYPQPGSRVVILGRTESDSPELVEAIEVMTMGSDAESKDPEECEKIVGDNCCGRQPFDSVRRVMNGVLPPLIDSCAEDIGSTQVERDTLKNKVKEASVALEGFAKGQSARVAPVTLKCHREISRRRSAGVKMTVDGLEEEFGNKKRFINELQSCVVKWTREINRVVEASRRGPEQILSAKQESLFWMSADLALQSGLDALGDSDVKLTLDLLVRNRRATGFLNDARAALESNRRRVSGYLTLLGDLPLDEIEKADSVLALSDAVHHVLNHINTKLRISSFPLDRAFLLVDSLSSRITAILATFLVKHGGVLRRPDKSFQKIFNDCSALFTIWYEGYDSFRRLCREIVKVRKEVLAPRQAPAFATLEKRLRSVADFRNDHIALNAVVRYVSSKLYVKASDDLADAMELMMEKLSHTATLDLSPVGEKRWTSSLNMYSSRIIQVEEALSNILVQVITEEHSISDMSTSAAPFKPILRRPSMSAAVTDILPVVIKAAEKELEKLGSIPLTFTSDSSIVLVDEVRGISPLSSSVIILRQVKRRISLLELEVSSLIGHLIETHPQSLTLKKKMQDILSRIKTRQLLEKHAEAMLNMSGFIPEPGLIFNIKRMGSSLYLVLEAFNPTVGLGMDLRLIREESRELVSQMKGVSAEMRSFGPSLVSIAASLQRYCAALNKLKEMDNRSKTRVQVCIDVKKRAVESEIAHGIDGQLNTSNPECVANFAVSFSKATSQFYDALISIVECEAYVLEELRFVRTSGEKADINSVKKGIQRIFSTLDAEGIQNTLYVKEVSELVVDEVSCFLKTALLHWRPQSSATAFINVDGTVELQPARWRLQENAFEALRVYIHDISLIPSALPPDSRTALRMSRLAAIIRCQSDVLHRAHIRILECLQFADEYIDRWNYTSNLLHVSHEVFNAQSGNQISEWITLLDILRGIRNTEIPTIKSDRFSSGRNENGCDVVLSSKSQQIIEQKLQSWQDFALAGLSELLAQEKEDIISLVGETVTLLNDFDDLMNLATVLFEVDPLIATCEQRAALCSKAEGILEIDDPSRSITNSLHSLRNVIHSKRQLVNNGRSELESKHENRVKKGRGEVAQLLASVKGRASVSNLSQELSEITTIIDRLGTTQKSLNEISKEGEVLGLRGMGAELQDVKLVVKHLEARLQPLKELDKEALFLKRNESTLLKDVNFKELRNTLQKAFDKAAGIEQSTAVECFASDAKKRITMLPILSKLKSLRFSPHRELDISKILFKQDQNEVQLKERPLRDFWACDFHLHRKFICGVIENAAGEANIMKYFQELEQNWSERKPDWISKNGCFLLRGFTDLLKESSEVLQSLSTLSNSPYAKLFESDRQDWERKISRMRAKLEVWAELQTKWVHLHALFAGDSFSKDSSVRQDLRKEVSTFESISSRFCQFTVKMSSGRGILENLSSSADSNLTHMLSDINVISKSLRKFLESQRVSFPRFFLLADDSLLDILSRSAGKIENVIPHLETIFPGVKTVKYEEQQGSIVVSAVISKEGENLPLQEDCIVEKKASAAYLLKDLERSVKITLQQLLPDVCIYLSRTMYSVSGPELDISYICESFPCQTAILASKIAFASAVESLFNERVKLLNKLRALISKVSLKYAAETNSLNMLYLEQLSKELVHQRNVLQRIKDDNASSASASLEWQKNIRFYSEKIAGEKLRVIARCADAKMDYGWEYLGVTDSLVQTKLTNHCILGLMQALKYGMGGSPFGPAGTGKTETVKFLGHSLGRLVIVFNCDESFDAASLGRILAGACRLGAWVCYDEFNRLERGILSEVSGHIAAIQYAIQNKIRSIGNFYGGLEKISVEAGTGIFITMNPKYKGRRELPANLKSLFRAIAMSRSDLRDIAEVSLFAKGFSKATVLSKKIVSLMRKMARTVRDSTYHDFGLRGLTSIILTAKSIRKDSMSTGTETAAAAEEEEIIEKAIMDTLGPKVAKLDQTELLASTKLLFQSSSRPSSLLPPSLRHAVLAILKTHNLTADDVVTGKLEQLYTLLKHHYGVLVVGPSGSGKSVTWKALYDAMVKTGHSFGNESSSSQVERGVLEGQLPADASDYSCITIDPKTLSMNSLYGTLDPTTREWTDGILTKTLRTIASRNVRSMRGMHWIVFDGEIDPDWVENLNSVLDDNHSLTLPSGERIPLQPNVRFLFEAENLKSVNLSTISRCGMICFHRDRELSYVVERYCSEVSLLSELHNRCIEHIKDLRDRAVQCVVHPRSDDQQISMTSNSLGIINSAFTMFVSYIQQYSDWLASQMDKDSEEASRRDHVEACFARHTFIMSFAISTSATLTTEGKERVTKSMLNSLADLSAENLPSDITKCNVSFETGQLVPYAKIIKSITLDDLEVEKIGSPDVIVPTVTTEALRETLSCILHGSSQWSRSAIGCASSAIPLLCGPPGSGKSMIINSLLDSISNISVASISFSSSTGPTDIIAALKSVADLSRTSWNTIELIPRKKGSRIVLFCDEINLCSPDSYGNLTTISFLRSLMLRQGYWSNRENEGWVSVPSLFMIAACNPSEDAGRNVLPERFLRHCTIIHVPNPTDEDLHRIFSPLISACLHITAPDFASLKGPFTNCIISMYQRNRNEFSPATSGPRVPHYIYSARDLCRLVKGVTFILLQERKVTTGKIVRALMHEGRRIFVDRLLSVKEKDSADMFLREAVLTSLRFDIDESCLVPTMFSSFLSRHGGRYCVVKDKEELRRTVYQKLRVFSQEEGLGGSLTASDPSQTSDVLDQFVVTDSVLDHLVRVERILRLPLGHAVLIGPPGSGKKTFTRFTGWMMDMRVHRVSAYHGYGAKELEMDLRSLLAEVVLKGRKTVIMFDEMSCEYAGMLEMMNALLGYGDIPGLFEGEERSKLISELRKGVNGYSSLSNDAAYRRFVETLRKDFHVVFTLTLSESEFARSSSIADELLSRSPALYNRCVVDYIGDWDDATLTAVADVKLQDVILGQERDIIVSSAVKMHRTVRNVTPRDYLEFAEQVARLALEKFEEIATNGKRVAAGLNRLRDAEVAIGILKERLEMTSARLEEREFNANAVLVRMADEQRRAERAKVEATEYSRKARDAAISAEHKQAMAEDRLKEVEPQVEQARLAVGGIRKEHLEELRAMPAPPVGVKLAVECVMVLLGEEATTWGVTRARMRGADLINRVLELDISAIDPYVFESLSSKIEAENIFDVEKIYFASKAAGPLAEWCLASLEYAAVIEETEPLRAEIHEIQEYRDDLLEKEKEAEDVVENMNSVIEECKRDYSQQIREAEQCRREMNDAQSKLTKAEVVLTSLNEEWEKWAADAEKYDEAATTLWGDSVLAAAFISYCGKLDRAARNTTCEQWKKILYHSGVAYADSWTFSDFLVTAEQKAVWTAARLPLDETSIESYVIIMRSARYPLVIDPLRNVHKMVSSVLAVENSTCDFNNSDDLDTLLTKSLKSIGRTSFSDADGEKSSYLTALEGAMRFGNKIVLEDAENFDYSLSGLIGQEAVNGSLEDGGAGNGQRSVRVCNRMIDQSPSFRLFLAAANLEHVPATARSRSCVVSFAICDTTVSTLCFSRSLGCFLPELEREREELLTEGVLYAERKRLLENRVLAVISGSDNSKENLLDGPLFTTLESLKGESAKILKKSQESMKQSARILKVRESLRPVLAASVRLYFVLQNLGSVNPLYQICLSKFLEMFSEAAQLAVSKTSFSCSKEDIVSDGFDVSNVMNELQGTICSVVYRSVAPSLFPQDQLPFAAAICLAAKREVSDDDSFIPGIYKMIELSSSLVYDNTSSDSVTGNKALLQDTKTLLHECFKSAVEFSELVALAVSEDALSRMQKLKVEDLLYLIPVARIQRPALIGTVITRIIELTPPLGSPSAFSESENSTPALRHRISSYANGSEATAKPVILVVRGSGVDPSSLVLQMSKEFALETIEVTLGSTVTVANSALETLNKYDPGSERSIFLMKNVHLARPEFIEKLRQAFLREREYPFLLVVTLEVSGTFGEVVGAKLGELCDRYAFEKPFGFKAAFQDAVNVVFSSKLKKEVAGNSKQALYEERIPLAIAWLHAQLLERSRRAPIGFSKVYDFTEIDLVLAKMCAESLEGKGMPTSAVAELMCEAVYGGRIENELDGHILTLITRDIVGRVLGEESGNEICMVSHEEVSKSVNLPLSFDALRAYISKMPLNPPLEWFGLGYGAEATLRAKEGSYMLGTLKTILKGISSPSASDTVASDAEASTARSKSSTSAKNEMIEKLISLLPTRSDCLTMSEASSIEIESTNSIQRFWGREKLLLVELLEDIRSDLDDVQNVLLSKKKMGRREDGILGTLAGNEIQDFGLAPEHWRRYSMKKPGIRAEALLKHYDSCFEFLRSAEQSKELNCQFILRPYALISVLQFCVCDELKIAVESTKPVLLVGKGLAKRQDIRDERIFPRILGLKLTGASWDDENQWLSSEENENIVLPPSVLSWELMESEDKKNDAKDGDRCIRVPIFVEHTEDANNVFFVELKTEPGIAPSKLRLQGAAIHFS